MVCDCRTTGQPGMDVPLSDLVALARPSARIADCDDTRRHTELTRGFGDRTVILDRCDTVGGMTLPRIRLGIMELLNSVPLRQSDRKRVASGRRRDAPIRVRLALFAVDVVAAVPAIGGGTVQNRDRRARYQTGPDASLHAERDRPRSIAPLILRRSLAGYAVGHRRLTLCDAPYRLIRTFRDLCSIPKWPTSAGCFPKPKHESAPRKVRMNRLHETQRHIMERDTDSADV